MSSTKPVTDICAESHFITSVPHIVLISCWWGMIERGDRILLEIIYQEAPLALELKQQEVSVGDIKQSITVAASF